MATRWMVGPIMVVDVETTGLDPVADRIWQLAIVEFVPGKPWREMQAWVTRCKPDVPFTPEALLIGGIEPAELEGKPCAEQIIGRVIDILGRGKIFAAYKSDFDFGFLAETHKRAKCKKRLPFDHTNTIDPLVFARALYSQARGWKLKQMAARLGVRLDRAHDALRDSMAAAEVMVRMAILNDLPPTLEGLLALQEQYRTAWVDKRGQAKAGRL